MSDTHESSPEKRSWKLVTKKPKDKGRSKAKPKAKVTGITKGKGKGKGKPSMTSGTKYTDVKRMREGEERWEETLRRASHANILLESTGLYQVIATLDHNLREECVQGQYAVARRIQDARWISSIRRDARFDFQDAWIEEHLPALEGSRLSQATKSRKTSAGEFEAGSSKDIRLEANPEMPVFRANAASGEIMPSEVVPIVSKTEDPLPLDEPMETSEVVLEDAPSAEKESAEVRVEESLPTIMERQVREAAEIRLEQESLPTSMERQASEEEKKTSEVIPPTLEGKQIRKISPVRAPTGSETKLKTVEKPSSSSSRKRASQVMAGSSRSQSKDQRKVQQSSTKHSITVTLKGHPPAKGARRDTNREDNLYCPIPSCNSHDRKLRRHVIYRHLPESFQHAVASPDNLTIQVDALRWLIRTVLGIVLPW